MFTVTVYSKPNCVQCTATTRALDKHGVSYQVKDLTAPEQADMLAYVTEELGCAQAPVVVVDGDDDNHWAGFRPDRIKALSLVP
ncbi:glutaredoxin-like protein NrdH [Litorihabitans aurantiacus]|uniref:Glutaredoxin-like protein NrdH n=1 Tax=Litorihabitans aurantiacus TaxID=1930061 RepID=A0AA37XIP2_9MICO|nr:glutaredoxin-like protein NrdH [Litorihabitans aurantiacus]GMA33670.1 glutaredoxin-like protein NrdH [Litorihabitans aurantiacus]GMA33739.1 glutaredoxin-like protein NrdH [Litorihabitans aurantiacus]